ncbi:hypothetical protein MCAV_01600 [[Mycoplasma] cavipharyngis]|uniref:hypothetical protein n=1 Tax=[Mycoplasma] cavipharyngis TaxID=92757 RepID=UPI003703E141
MIQNDPKTIDSFFSNYIQQKKRFLKRQIFLATLTDKIINWIQVILNFIILLLAIITIWWATEIRHNSASLPFLKNVKFDETGFIYTIVVAVFMLLLFLLSLFIAGYKMSMRWQQYRYMMNEIEYLIIANKNNPQYSEDDWNNDYQKIIDQYLAAVKVPWLTLLKNTLKGDRGAK